MNRIWNSTYGDNTNVKRISNTINFKIGQRVYGRIVKTLDVNQAIIKLLNGMELHADIEEGISEFNQGLLQFEVEGTKDDKLQLKLFQRPNHENSNLNNELMKFIEQEGFSKSDESLLEGMLKYDLNLSKENVSQAKSLLEFNQRINNNPEEIDNFIEKYIASKGIKDDSIAKDNITSNLKSFFNSYKSLNADEILLFLENNIEFTEENINSYNSIFKGEANIDESLNNINKALEQLMEPEYTKETPIANKEITHENKEQIGINKENINNVDKIIETKEIQRDNIKSTTEIVKDGLKSLSDLVKSGNSDVSNDEVINIFNKLRKMPLEKVTIDVVRNTLSEVLDKEVEVTKDSFEKIFNAIKEIDEGAHKLDLKDNQNNLGSEVKKAIVAKSEETKEIIQRLLSAMNDDEKDLSQVINTMKNSINDVKLFNKFSNEYYYLDFPVNFKEQEYPCKLIIKDNRKEGKKLDSKNIKLALNIKTSNLGSVDAYVKVINKSIDIEISCNKDYSKVFEKSTEKLKLTMKSLGFIVSISVTNKDSELDFTTSREFFGENNVAGIDIKV